METTSRLSAEERAYFESGGETEIPPAEGHETGGLEAGIPEELSSEEPEEEGGVTSPDDVTPPDGRRPKQVPHAKYHEERRRRQELEADLQKIRDEAAAYRGKLELLAEAMRRPQAEEAAPQVAEEQIPDPETDIFAFAKWQKAQIEKLQQQVSERTRAEQEATQRQEAERTIWGKWDADTKAITAEKADFSDAATFLASVRDRALARNAVFDTRFNDKAFRDSIINQELAMIVAQAAEKGLNAASIVYDYALDYGYTPKSPEPAVNPIEEASKRIEELNKTQAANKSLSDTGGRGAAAMTADEILAMPDKELTRWLNKSPKNREFFDKLLGA